MVINDLDVIRITVFPRKADAPLLVDPDAVLAFSVMMQCFHVIRRWDSQSLKKARCIENLEFDHRRSLNCSWQLFGEALMKDGITRCVNGSED